MPRPKFMWRRTSRTVRGGERRPVLHSTGFSLTLHRMSTDRHDRPGMVRPGYRQKAEAPDGRLAGVRAKGAGFPGRGRRRAPAAEEEAGREENRRQMAPPKSAACKPRESAWSSVDAAEVGVGSAVRARVHAVRERPHRLLPRGAFGPRPSREADLLVPVPDQRVAPKQSSVQPYTG